jgi:hypothetical protein
MWYEKEIKIKRGRNNGSPGIHQDFVFYTLDTIIKI